MSSKSSRTDLPDTVLVGRILRPHGLRGELVVEVLSDVDDRLDPGSSLLLADAAGRPLAAAGVAGLPLRIEVLDRRPHKSGALVRFAGVADKDGAEKLRGAWLAVERSRVPRAPDGTFYHYELLGCRCSDGGRELGLVVDLREDGGGLLLIVEGGGRRVPVPFVGRFIRRIDVASGVIDLDLPPGLIEECASTS